ncbi:hypothetical protein ACNOYE_33075 [Nannocystaceae bacterium ST9]
MVQVPSDLHQGLLALLRADLVLALELVFRSASLLPVIGGEVRDLGTDLRLPNPFGDDWHLRPDLVIGIFHEGVLQEVWILECQLHRAPGKPDVISAYRAAAQLQYGVPAHSAVFSPKPAIRTWLMRLIETGMYDPPVLIQPHCIPWIIDFDQARQRPYACLFHAFFHAHHPDALPVLKVALQVARAFPAGERERYTAMLLRFTSPAMNETLRAHLRAMTEEPEPDEWDMACAGFQQAIAKATREGRLEGRVEGLGTSILDILELRGLTIDAHTRERVKSCRDLVRLERWYERAKYAAAIELVFVD